MAGNCIKTNLDFWLETLSENEEEGFEKIITQKNFVEPKTKFIKILNRLTNQTEKLELRMRNIILDNNYFPSRII
jgi:hypothetical protein